MQSCDSLSWFIRSEEFGIPAWIDHVASWLPHADITIRYEDLQIDAAAVIQSTLNELGVGEDIEATVIEEAARRSEFDEMQKIEEEEGRPHEDEFEDNFRFARKGSTGEWRRRYSKEDKEYMFRRIESGLGTSYKNIL